MIFNAYLKKDLITAILIWIVSTLIVAILLFFTTSAWLPDTTFLEKIYHSLRLGSASWVMAYLWLLVVSMIGYFTPPKSKLIAKIALVLFILSLIWSAATVYDRVQWVKTVTGSVNYELISELKDKASCEESILAGFSIRGDTTVIRCGGMLYPRYDEFTLSTKKFLAQMPGWDQKFIFSDGNTSMEKKVKIKFDENKKVIFENNLISNQ